MRYFAIVLAAGTGQRLKNKNKIPKQFLKIQGRSILLRSINKFLGVENFEKIILSINPEYIEEYERELSCLDNLSRKKLILVHGGGSRAESLHLSMLFLSDYLNDNKGKTDATICSNLADSIGVITHDVARPFLQESIIQEHIRRLSLEDILATVIPSTDTIFYTSKRINDRAFANNDTEVAISHVINRDFCVNAQTPQSITLHKYFQIWQEHKSFVLEMQADFIDYSNENKNIDRSVSEYENDLSSRLFDGLTDLISMIDLSKHKVGLVLGDSSNIKITTNIDLAIAKLLAKE